jgi:manganese/zinc/iron transport system ATP- binding protein
MKTTIIDPQTVVESIDKLDYRAELPPDESCNMAAVSVRGLTVSYGERPVLRSVSFDVNSGQIVGVVGPNGAGKSTLLRAILGLIPLDAGSITLSGKPISQCRNRVAYVPQTEAVDWDFPVTVQDVVLMGRYGRLGLFGRPKHADRSAAEEALELVGMTEYAHRHIRQLSGGQQQRVFLARALCQDADILLLDEPFAGVDAATEQTIFDLITKMAAQGKTLIVVNHDLSVLDRFDIVLLLNQQVVAFGPTNQAVNDRNLHRTYGGRLTLLDRADSALRDNRGDS